MRLIESQPDVDAVVVDAVWRLALLVRVTGRWQPAPAMNRMFWFGG